MRIIKYERLKNMLEVKIVCARYWRSIKIKIKICDK